MEMKDRSSRPAILEEKEYMNDCDVVFVGFPVWWGREPSIIDTFMERYDFSGKAVVPFATSWSSGIGSAGVNMQALAAGARVAAGVTYPKTMLMYGKEASNRKQEIDRQHYTIPNQRPKDKHCGKI